jgi:hypothetical protein
MAAANWPVIEKALQDIVCAGTGLADANVYFADGKPRPNDTHIVMLLQTTNTHTSEATWARNPTPTGTTDTVVHTSKEQVRCELQLQCYAKPPAGVSTARAVLLKLGKSLRLPSQRVRLNAAGIGLVDFEAVQVTPAIQNVVVFEPRAVTTLIFNVADEVTETGTNIITVEVTPTIDGDALATRVISVDNP